MMYALDTEAPVLMWTHHDVIILCPNSLSSDQDRNISTDYVPSYHWDIANECATLYVLDSKSVLHMNTPDKVTVSLSLTPNYVSISELQTYHALF